MTTLWEEQLEFSDVSEVRWSTSTIMAIFMAASLISAVFFGLGYTFGRGGTSKLALKTQPDPMVSTAAVIKPKVYQAAIAPPHSSLSSSETLPRHTEFPTKTEPHPSSPSFPQVTTIDRGHVLVALQKIHKTAAAQVAEHPAVRKMEALSGTAARYMVQVGAVGDRKDARMLVSQLRHHGMHAEIYPAKHDKFLHVQIGPFMNVQQAQAMRHHVIANGYRAILKRAS